MDVFKEYAAVYDALNQEKDYASEAAEIVDLVKEYKEDRDILMLGCGTGKHDRELAKYGYRIHGVDVSEEMVRRAQEQKRNLPLSYEVADIRNYQSGKKYPLVLSLFHVISYQNSNKDLVDTFKGAARHLTDDGIFIFDTWYGPGVLHDLPAIRIKRVETDTLNIMRIAEPEMHIEKNVVDVNYDILMTEKETGIQKEITEKHSMRYLFGPEVAYLLEKSGLRLIKCLDCKTLKRPDIKTWTAYFIAGKK